MSDVKKKISDEVKSYWEKKRKPLLFSTIGEKFKEIKSEEGFVNIGGWVSKNIDDLDSVVYTDPNKPEYIGLIPTGENYEPESQQLLSTSRKKETHNNEKVVLDFLHILNDLDDDDLRRVIIPTDILVRLMK
ncbi:hypothetical protein [Erwinia sp. S59]|uniref:hypothetical protein n=1 Tax=Erwinia sp. S59 TaxID=2769340 RepID=UPI00190DFB84|nr:hypothetical protein [Erwinia sp. S59]MBK0094302.1 hypothetical protein [Erwinia sp. S59]